MFTDYLGNVRLSYKNTSTTGVALQIVEENNYYPFGLKHKGYNNTPIAGQRDHKYGFGGKEEQSELGLEWMDFHARNYDAGLGRWMNIDPLAEKYLPLSPYSYAANSPLYYVDPNGKEILIYYGSGNNVRSQEYTYKKDRDYSGIKDQFLQDTFKALDALYQASEIEVDGIKVNILSELIKSSSTLSIDKAGENVGTKFFKNRTVKTNRSNGVRYENKTNAIGTIHFDNENGVLFDDLNNLTPQAIEKDGGSKNAKINSATSVLGHDLGHAYNFLNRQATSTGNDYNDRVNNKKFEQNGFIFINQEEARATTMSTQININLKENPRLNHDGFRIKTKGVLSREKL